MYNLMYMYKAERYKHLYVEIFLWGMWISHLIWKIQLSITYTNLPHPLVPAQWTSLWFSSPSPHSPQEHLWSWGTGQTRYHWTVSSPPWGTWAHWHLEWHGGQSIPTIEYDTVFSTCLLCMIHWRTRYCRYSKINLGHSVYVYLV